MSNENIDVRQEKMIDIRSGLNQSQMNIEREEERVRKFQNAVAQGAGVLPPWQK